VPPLAGNTRFLRIPARHSAHAAVVPFRRRLQAPLMLAWRRTDGQAAAELVALLPLGALLLAGAWQLVVAGHASWSAGAAARAAARASALGADAGAAARAELPSATPARPARARP
jgi:hypothetical protein